MRHWMAAAAVLPVALLTHAAAGFFTLFSTCAVSDTAGEIPARASVQGRLCGEGDHWLSVVPWLVLGLGVVLAVVLTTRLVASRRWRWVGLSACLWVPVVAVAVLAAPSDTCSPEQYATGPAYECSRAGNG